MELGDAGAMKPDISCVEDYPGAYHIHGENGELMLVDEPTLIMFLDAAGVKWTRSEDSWPMSDAKV